MLALKTHVKVTVPRFGVRKRLVGVSLAIALAAIAFAVLHWLPTSAAPEYLPREVNSPRARLNGQVSIRAIGGADPRVTLQNGHDLLTSYQGPQHLQHALMENKAQPRSLASADFDEDGVPDLVSSYAYNGCGIITFHRGNVDSIYPNAPEAQQRRAGGTFTDAPFISPALVFDVPTPADFIGAGDFDADGHWDLVTATRGGTELYLLSGNGKGNLAPPTVIALPGIVTALTAGEINRSDGLADIAVGVRTSEGSKALIFEGPEGALKADPEILPMPATITDLALGQLDDEYAMDLAVASGQQLVIIYGRDRKLSLDTEVQVTVKEARREIASFKAAIKAVAIGDFSGKQQASSDVALLTADGKVLVRTREDNKVSRSNKRVSRWQHEVVSSVRRPEAMKLVKVRVSSLPKDNLLVIDGANGRLHVVTKSQMAKANTATYALLDGNKITSESLSINGVGDRPVAVLPMRLNRDALSDLVILEDHNNSPAVILTGQNNNTSDSAKTDTPPPAGLAPLAPGCTVEVINPGNVLSRTLNAGCASSTGHLMDLYSFNGTAGQQAVIAMSSSAFNTFLFLVGPDGSEITRDDNGGDGTNSRIPPGSGSLTLPAIGTYTIQATSRHPNETGNYTISLSLGPCATVVTTTNDSGLGSLRQAILNANACPGVDTITFNIGSGVQTISPITPLPSITEAVTIDGTTQPGFAGRPIIELSGASTGGGVPALDIVAGNSTVRGLVINRFSFSQTGAGGTGIQLTTNGGNIIEGNFVGTDINGVADLGNTFGIRIEGTKSVAQPMWPETYSRVISSTGFSWVPLTTWLKEISLELMFTG